MYDLSVFRPRKPGTVATLFRAACKWFAPGTLILACATLAPAQSQTPAQTPFLFASTPVSQTQDGIVTMLRDPHSGVLTLLPGSSSTFKDPCIPEVMEPQGQFLFGACGDGLAMYSFDSTSGAVTEIATSPYAISTSGYLYVVAPESTGQFVYLLKFTSSETGAVNYILDTFQIDRSTTQLVPLTSETLPFGSSMVGAAADPNGHGIVVVGTQADPVTSATTAAAFVITFDPITGAATIPTTGVTVLGSTPTSFALSPQGKYFALGSTTSAFSFGNVSYASLFVMSTSTFEFATAPASLISPANGIYSTEPLFLSFDSLGGLLYVQYANSPQPPQGASPFEVYQVADLSHVGTILFEQGDILFTGIPDPDAPYRYEAAAGTPPQGIAVWLIDPGTGVPLQPPTLANPFYPSMNLNPVFANYLAAGSGQNLSGPFLSQSAGALVFGQTTTGQNSAAQTVTLKSVGGQPASLTSVVVSGANAADFVLSGNCLTTPLLAPQASCALLVTYSPAKVGISAGVITITGNSPTSPQTIVLSGTGIAPPAPAPVASFNTANPFNLPGTTTQGTSSSPQNITLSNTGNAPLHIATVTLNGFNAADYSVGASNCSGAIAANSSCVIPVTFSPLAAGIRAATITVTDDAANSPQILTINGTATPAASITPPSGGTTSASVSAGQTAQYNLTATPGAGFSGTLTFSCSGSPFGATCTVPASVTVANGAVAPFTVSISTASASVFLPELTRPPAFPVAPSPFFFLGTFAAVLSLFLGIRKRENQLYPLRFAASAFMATLLVTSGIGCGSSGSSTQPPPQPQAAATPVISPSSGTFSTAYPTVTITDGTPGATIRYTTDGSTPTSASPVYAAPFTMSTAGTVQAIATATGYNSSLVASAVYKVQTASGTYTVMLTPTATANGSSKQLQMNPIMLSLTVK